MSHYITKEEWKEINREGTKPTDEQTARLFEYTRKVQQLSREERKALYQQTEKEKQY